MSIKNELLSTVNVPLYVIVPSTCIDSLQGMAFKQAEVEIVVISIPIWPYLMLVKVYKYLWVITISPLYTLTREINSCISARPCMHHTKNTTIRKAIVK